MFRKENDLTSTQEEQSETIVIARSSQDENSQPPLDLSFKIEMSGKIVTVHYAGKENDLLREVYLVLLKRAIDHFRPIENLTELNISNDISNEDLNILLLKLRFSIEYCWTKEDISQKIIECRFLKNPHPNKSVIPVCKMGVLDPRFSNALKVLNTRLDQTRGFEYLFQKLSQDAGWVFLLWEKLNSSSENDYDLDRALDLAFRGATLEYSPVKKIFIIGECFNYLLKNRHKNYRDFELTLYARGQASKHIQILQSALINAVGSYRCYENEDSFSELQAALSTDIINQLMDIDPQTFEVKKNGATAIRKIIDCQIAYFPEGKCLVM